MAVSDAILTRLLTLHPKIIDLSLDRMERILARLGHPERKLPPVIHIAGTNGKGSTVAFCRAMIEAAGLTAHCYTSPHLVRFHERIRLGKDLIAESALSALLEECEAANGGAPITFFEITTAAAFLAFSRTPADYLILEVGLGGRLDATNVTPRPRATAITSLGLDHQQFLGETIEQIAREKAGILKRGVPAVIGRMPPEARAAIEEVAEKAGAPLAIAGQDWDVFEQHGRLVFQDGRLEGFLGYDSQGFLDAWAPVFFFAMIFAISMDYTVFLLASAKEHYDRSGDPREAMVGGVAHSGRVIFAAAAVMVAVFFTFAISGPLPPKEMGVILGVAVLLDALLIRLVLMPVMLRLLGRSAWACPRWLARLLPDVRFGH